MADLHANVPASTPKTQPAAQASAPNKVLLELVRADVNRGDVPPRIKPVALRGAGLEESLIRCCACGATGEEEYVALERTAPLSRTPLPHSAVRLICIPCLALEAQRSRVPPNADAVGKFVDERVMGACEACAQIMGLERMGWGVAGGKGQKLY